METDIGAAVQDSERLTADRAWVRWGMAAAVTGMLAWVLGVALIPLDAKLEKGEQLTLAQRGPFAADGIIAGLVPVTTVIWILDLAATLPRSRRAAVTATFQTGG